MQTYELPLLHTLPTTPCKPPEGLGRRETAGEGEKHRPAQALQDVVRSERIRGAKRARTREGGSGTRIDRYHGSHWGSHVLPGPLQSNHFCRQATATANAINERDAAPDAAVR